MKLPGGVFMLFYSAFAKPFRAETPKTREIILHPAPVVTRNSVFAIKQLYFRHAFRTCFLAKMVQNGRSRAILHYKTAAVFVLHFS